MGSLIGNLIRDIRINRKLKQSDLAELSGLSKSYISEIEKGIKTPKTDQIEVICKALNVPMWALFYMAKGEDAPQQISLGKLKEELIDSLNDLQVSLASLVTTQEARTKKRTAFQERKEKRRQKRLLRTTTNTSNEIYQDRTRIKDQLGRRNKISVLTS